MKNFKKISGFIWDSGNKGKNLKKHNVSDVECEETFFDPNKVIFNDILHSEKETRFIILGKTKADKILFSVFTTRGDKIRIISSRSINKKEKHLYEKTN